MGQGGRPVWEGLRGKGGGTAAVVPCGESRCGGTAGGTGSESSLRVHSYPLERPGDGAEQRVRE